MNARLAARELHNLGPALGPDELVQDSLYFLQGQVEARPGAREAEWAVHVAGAVDLDDAQARVLLVLRAEPTVIGAALTDLRVEREGDGAGLVEAGVADVGFGVGVDQGLEWAVVGTPLAHEYPALAKQDLRVDHAPAVRTDAAGQLIEDVVGVLLEGRRASRGRRGHGHSLMAPMARVVSGRWRIPLNRRPQLGQPTVTNATEERRTDGHRLRHALRPGRHRWWLGRPGRGDFRSQDGSRGGPGRGGAHRWGLHLDRLRAQQGID